MLSDIEVVERILNHIDNNTTDLGQEEWREPIENYNSIERFAAEIKLMKHIPVPFCPAASLQEPGDYVAHNSAGVPIVATKDKDGTIYAFRNACRHRGKQVATGHGNTKVFKCSYHGWTYRLDGSLEYIPGEHGFPNFDKTCNGLVPVQVDVRGGVVFITQEAPIKNDILETLPHLLDEKLNVFSTSQGIGEVNWKLNMEATMEGYHIKTTHPTSFYPYGYDNLNVIDVMGSNSRITFPFRRIERLRDLPKTQWHIDRLLTYVYNIFPYTTVAKLSNHTSLSISEPLSPTQTQFFTFRLSEVAKQNPDSLKRAQKDANFLADTGGKEDTEAIQQIQASLNSGANTHFTFGHFEQVIVNFHKHLHAALDALPKD